MAFWASRCTFWVTRGCGPTLPHRPCGRRFPREASQLLDHAAPPALHKPVLTLMPADIQHIHTHAYTPTGTHTAPAHRVTCILTQTPECIHSPMYAQSYTHVHTRLPTHVQTPCLTCCVSTCFNPEDSVSSGVADSPGTLTLGGVPALGLWAASQGDPQSPCRFPPTLFLLLSCPRGCPDAKMA